MQKYPKFDSPNLFSAGKGRTINCHFFYERKTTHENIYTWNHQNRLKQLSDN